MSQHLTTPKSLSHEASPAMPQSLTSFGKSVAWLVVFGMLFYGAAMAYGAYLGVTQPELLGEDFTDDTAFMEVLLSPASLTTVSVMQALLLIPAVLFAAHFSNQNWRETLAFRLVPLRALGFWSLIYALYFGVQAVMELFAPVDLGEVITPLAGTRHFGLALAFVVIAPLIEELVFRGYLFAAWRHTRLGLWGTLILTSVLFTALHMEQYSGLLLGYLFVFSLILGLAREKTGSIWTPLILHMVNNLIAVIFLVYLGIY